MDIGVALSGVTLLVDAWSMGAAPALVGGAIPQASLVEMTGNNAGQSWWNTTWYRTGAALLFTILFSTTLVLGLRTVLNLGLALHGGERRTWLHHWYDGVAACTESDGLSELSRVGSFAYSSRKVREALPSQAVVWVSLRGTLLGSTSGAN